MVRPSLSGIEWPIYACHRLLPDAAAVVGLEATLSATP
jgi:hypothetical protein